MGKYYDMDLYLFNSEPFKNLKRTVNAISYKFVWIRRSTTSSGVFWVPEGNHGYFNNYLNMDKKREIRNGQKRKEMQTLQTSDGSVCLPFVCSSNPNMRHRDQSAHKK